MTNSLQVNLPRSWAGSNSSLQEKSERSFFLFYYYRMEDEAVLDRGASFLKHVCDEEEVEGKRAGPAGEEGCPHCWCWYISHIETKEPLLYRVISLEPE